MVDNQNVPSAASPLEYEETPVMEPVAEGPSAPPTTPVTEPPPSVPPVPVKKGSTFFGFLGNLILFIILFGAGIGLSLFLRQYLPSGTPASTINQLPTPTFPATPSAEISTDPYATWQTYQVISGATRQAITGISFKLPADIPAPICDGGNCASQGTYLSGGTRFTVAPRGAGQLLPDYRGRIVSDLAGQAFIVREASVSGKPAVEFSGLFTGTTNGGYAFSQMHGFMIQATDALSLEINHFTPSGVTADFAADDTLFAKIVKSLNFPVTSAPQPTVKLTPTTSPVPTATATGTPSSY